MNRILLWFKGAVPWLRHQAVTQPIRNNRSLEAVQEDTARQVSLNRIHALLFAVLGLVVLLAGYWLSSSGALSHFHYRQLVIYGCYGEGVVLLASSAIATRMSIKASEKYRKLKTSLR
ncbi:MAG TPA: hypothetical protein VMR75_01850 [Candidatus Saccharimonadales bacterium]|jgi:hypothetical protein|nr:hypothetical protein [Candidatus Saccharimonadales bacterium]